MKFLNPYTLILNVCRGSITQFLIGMKLIRCLTFFCRKPWDDVHLYSPHSVRIKRAGKSSTTSLSVRTRQIKYAMITFVEFTKELMSHGNQVASAFFKSLKRHSNPDEALLLIFPPS